MSYRELRSFTETMRALAYPRPISVDNFRTPNFPLVAEILLWLVERYDPSASIPESIETESARVAFLTAIATVLASKARLSVKTKNLYAADGRAVKEMLKVAKLLHASIRACTDARSQGADDDAPQGAEDFTMSIRASDVAGLRASASEITERGARLFELLKRENELKDARGSALRFLEAVSGSLDARAEHEYIERSVRDAISSLKDNAAALERQVSELTEDERGLASKLSKKQAELARSQKRLESLAGVRPAFMDEYEKLERELADEYDAYITRYRNLQYLEHELDEFSRRERAKMEASNRALRKLQKRLKEEEFKAFRGDENVAEDEAGMERPAARAAVERGRDPNPRPAGASGRPPAASGSVRPGATAAMNGRHGSASEPRVVGRMDGPHDDDEDEDDEEEDDEDEDLGSDEDLGDDDDDEDLDEDDEDDGDEDGDF